VLPGAGNGTFGAAVAVPDDGSQPAAVAVADFDGDGSLDLAVSQYYDSYVSLHRGAGTTTFGPPAAHFSSRWSSTIVAADLDGDDLPDLAVGQDYHGPTGSPDVLLVLPNQGPALLGFADEVTLRWPAQCLALSYNVYRGAISELVDANSNGLPDGGYGECLNEIDPDLTDRALLDDEIPTSGDGFFYLATAVELGGEQSLGATSGGFERLSGLPCP